MERKQFKQSPLPFTGQKRQFLTHFKRVLNDNITNDGDGWTIIDVFGGSGLLSHTAKCLKPKASVIYNDFDGFSERLKHINEINQLRQQLYHYLRDAPRNKRLSPQFKQGVIERINAFSGFKDVKTLSSWLLFSGTQVSSFEEFCEHDFWHTVRKTDYPEAETYLDGLEITHQSFAELIPQFRHNKKALLILDPPYLCTHQASYRQSHYFDLIDFLRLIDLTRPPYIFFSSTKSEFIRFLAYLTQAKRDNWQAFEGAQRISIETSPSYNGRYEDNLVFKF